MTARPTRFVPYLLERPSLPPGALVLGLTPLLDQRGVDALMDLRGRGFQVVLLVISPVPFIRPGESEAGEQAFRLWRLQKEVVQARYPAPRRARGRVAPGRPLGGRCGGGGDIPAPSPRPRLTAGAVAVATTIALAGLVAWSAGREGRPLLLAVGILAALLQAAAVVRPAFPLATASAVVLLADYAVAAVISPGACGAVAVAFGSGLLLAAELAAWSVDLARTGSEPAHLVRRRAATLIALVLGSAAFSDAVMAPAAQLGTARVS